jgi:hypothetical protein
LTGLATKSIPAAQKAQPLETDTRSTTTSLAEIRLLTHAGAKEHGTIMHTRDGGPTLSPLRRLVPYGSAELVRSELCELTLSDQHAEASREAQAARLTSASKDQVPRERD